MRTLRYIPIGSVISDIYRDTGIDTIPENDMVEWICNAMEHMWTRRFFSVSTFFMDVENYSCPIPEGAVEVLQIAKHNNIDCCKSIHNGLYFKPYCNDCEGIPMERKCECEDRNYVEANLHGSNWGWFFPVFWYHPDGKIRRPWTPVRVSGNNFFGLGREDGKACSPRFEYAIADGKILFSFDKGFVAISCLCPAVDSSGMPLVPDNISAREAIVRYVLMKYMQRMWYLGRDGYADKWQKAEIDWHWYLKQFKTKLKMPSEDEYRSLARHEKDPITRFSSDFWGYVTLCENIVTGDCVMENPDRSVDSKEELFVTNDTEGDTRGITIKDLVEHGEDYDVFKEGSESIESEKGLLKRNNRL